MRAIGARTGHILRLYLAMTLLVAVAATLAALAPAILIGRALLNQMFGFLGIQPASFAGPVVDVCIDHRRGRRVAAVDGAPPAGHRQPH
jgi:ABC-type antimicrobial peptide transport system permease subunit